MPASRRFRVSLTVEVSVAEPFIKNGVPDQQLITRMAAFKISRAGSLASQVTMTWVPVVEASSEPSIHRHGDGIGPCYCDQPAYEVKGR